MKQSKRFFLLSLAILIGLGGGTATALPKAGSTIVTLCYRKRTIKVPSFVAARFLAKPGTTAGACPVTPP